jgi:hypothetical protein
LQARISSAEFTDWQAYFRIEPQGYELDTWRWGMMTASIVNAVRSTIPQPKGKRIKVFKASDFSPFSKGEKPQDDLTPAQRKYIEGKRRKKRV